MLPPNQNVSVVQRFDEYLKVKANLLYYWGIHVRQSTSWFEIYGGHIFYITMIADLVASWHIIPYFNRPYLMTTQAISKVWHIFIS